MLQSLTNSPSSASTASMVARKPRANAELALNARIASIKAAFTLAEKASFNPATVEALRSSIFDVKPPPTPTPSNSNSNLDLENVNPTDLSMSTVPEEKKPKRRSRRRRSLAVDVESGDILLGVASPEPLSTPRAAPLSARSPSPSPLLPPQPSTPATSSKKSLPSKSSPPPKSALRRSRRKSVSQAPVGLYNENQGTPEVLKPLPPKTSTTKKSTPAPTSLLAAPSPVVSTPAPSNTSHTSHASHTSPHTSNTSLNNTSNTSSSSSNPIPTPFFNARSAATPAPPLPPPVPHTTSNHGHNRTSSAPTVAVSNTSTKKRRRKSVSPPKGSGVSATEWEMLANQSRLRSLKRKGLTSPKVAPTATALPSLPSSLKKPKYSPSPTYTTTNTLNSPDTMTNRSHSLSHSYALSNPDSSFGEVFLKNSSNNPNELSGNNNSVCESVDTVILDSSTDHLMNDSFTNSISNLSPVATERSASLSPSSANKRQEPTPTAAVAPPSPPTPPKVIPTPDTIVTKMMDLFADIPIGCNLTTTSCSSARVFAAALLHLTPADLPPASLPLILPLLTSFVDAELCVLASQHSTTNSTTPSHSPPSSRTRLMFCAYDFSAVSPPVDVEVGSNAHLERCVQKIAVIIKNMNCMVGLSPEHPARTALKSLLSFATMLANKHSPEGREMRENLNATMPTTANWMAARFLGAARFYKKELAVALDMACEVPDEFNDGIKPSPLRLRLGELIGASCRFHLRRLFNPIPPSYTKPGVGQAPADYSACRSTIHEIVCMEAPGGQDSAAADGSISSVLNSALMHVYEAQLAKDHIELSRNSTKSSKSSGSDGGGGAAAAAAVDPNASFVVSAISMRGLEGNGPLSDDDLELVMQDIELAHVALAGSRAAKFIIDLMNWEGVAKALEDSGGWECIETYAALISEVKLETIAVDEAHFVLLRDVAGLLTSLTGAFVKSEQSGQAASRCLNDMWRRFKCGKLNAAALRRNPNVGVIRTALVEGNAKFVYPTLAVPEDEEEEDYVAVDVDVGVGVDAGAGAGAVA
ncbi:hypothetical protein TrVE_jg1565 [Triparma verrucosa]|uniref:Uncharacterized protein n=1 Tax=Triparma verrucosa TaxID=1606542 RepID=A0A9W7FMF2_9STRA|nr:hypothetical protein TrVE_jg1565 [Triparma verrucosa]